MAASLPPDPEVVIDDGQAAPSPPRRRATVERRGAPVIVIVDDDLLIQDILVRAFGIAHTVHVAYDGADGLALIRSVHSPEHGGRVDLVITDVMMPKMSGVDLLRALREDPATKPIPVIMLTARASSNDVAEAINAGARSYVTKPFKLKELLAQAEKILASRRA